MKTRSIVQLSFLLLILVGVFVWEANCEIWCPFGGIESAYTYLTDGNMTCSLGTSNFFILGSCLLMTLLARRVFCGYACPIGTISEWTHRLGRAIALPKIRVPSLVDRFLSPLRYVVLVLILFLTWRAGELLFRKVDPVYALISRHGEDITVWAYVVLGGIVLLSLLITLPFCRWFCPFAAVLAPLSRLAPNRIVRDRNSCIDCGLCSERCPMEIPVASRNRVVDNNCTLCMECIDSCPKKGERALAWKIPFFNDVRGYHFLPVLVLLFSLSVGVFASYAFPLPSFFVRRDVPRPEKVESVDLQVSGLTCRGTANRLWGIFLDRNDLYAIKGYLQMEAWFGSKYSKLRVTYDPRKTNVEEIKRAVTEPYFNLFEDMQNSKVEESPFGIKGYDPLQALEFPDDSVEEGL